MNIGEVMIAIRGMRAPWLEQRHITVLSMLASRVPNVWPTVNDLVDETKMCRRSVMSTIDDVRTHGLVSYDKSPGKRHTYIINLGAMLALGPPVPVVASEKRDRSGIRNVMPDRAPRHAEGPRRASAEGPPVYVPPSGVRPMAPSLQPLGRVR